MVVLLVGLPFSVLVQEPENLVLNPSFEDIENCSPSPNAIGLVSYWRNSFVIGSAGFFSNCNSTYFGSYSVPYNSHGYQLARTGNSYGFQTNFQIETNGFYIRKPSGHLPHIFKEPLTGKFKNSLIEDKTYYLEFYVSKCDLDQSFFIGTNAFDLVLHNSLDDLTYPQPPFIVESDIVWSNPESNIVSDTSDWMKLSGCFTAKGGEFFFSIGSFRDTTDFEIEYYGVSSQGFYSARYFYDDFLIYQCDTCCPDQYPVQDYITVNNTLLQQGDPVYFETFLNKGNTANLYLFDSAGRIVYQHYLSGTDNTHQIPISLAAGIYHYAMVTSEKKKLGGKIVVF